MELTQTRQDFEKQIREYFDAVVRKDAKTFFKHLHRDHFIVAILPGDRMITSYDEYVTFSDWWHQNQTGRWSYEIELVSVQSETRATVVILALYDDFGKTGEKFSKRIRIKDNFVKVGGVWLMTESQNTVTFDPNPISA